MRYLLLIFLIIWSFTSCKRGNGDEQAIATYQDEYLYLSDINQSIPDNISSEDSTKLLQNLVDNWLSRQLLYERAMGHQLHNEADIERKVEKYRKNLIIHYYKSQLLNEKIDTVISTENITKYYNAHQDEFRLQNNIARVYFIKMPKSVPNATKVRYWMRHADNKDKLIELKEFSYQNARYYDFENQWISFASIRKLLPEQVTDEQQFLENHKIYQKRDSLYWYFMRVNEYLLKGDIAPMQYVIPDIKQIILSKRKLDFINELENNLIREARNNQKIKTNI